MIRDANRGPVLCEFLTLSARPQLFIIYYYLNLVIMPVDNNKHQRIDDVFIGPIS